MFSHRLAEHGFDVFQMLAVDLLHKFELGVWKATFTHLIRILVSFKADLVLDNRYHQTPTFGGFVICRFHNNVSEMKKLAAHDFKDILQCAIPCFEGMFTSHTGLNQIVSDLLFDLSHWHALAKLRIPDDSTILSLEEVTKSLGSSLRRFATQVKDIPMKELSSEVDHRGHRAAKKAAKASTEKSGKGGKQDTEAMAVARVAEKAVKATGTKLHEFNLSTAKECGTTDSYSTLNVKVEYRLSKKRYGQMNRNNFEAQVARADKRVCAMCKVSQQIKSVYGAPKRLACKILGLPE
ncbi:hypothetical protein E1B28_000806 [Marasmius oreades]|uniref:Uncharacterized protein n=1 Tax=Marasmius oreades TaxID=181124 RepID=A0A9P8AEI7_9AGAR|nr:uncharacterized protein E1B28_000806 [Marasmius oreades]KAG7098906.1 hypothetical protein E1B28_000806 [Marasmius oreades]